MANEIRGGLTCGRDNEGFLRARFRVEEGRYGPALDSGIIFPPNWRPSCRHARPAVIEIAFPSLPRLPSLLSSESLFSSGQEYRERNAFAFIISWLLHNLSSYYNISLIICCFSLPKSFRVADAAGESEGVGSLRCKTRRNRKSIVMRHSPRRIRYLEEPL